MDESERSIVAMRAPLPRRRDLDRWMSPRELATQSGMSERAARRLLSEWWAKQDADPSVPRVIRDIPSGAARWSYLVEKESYGRWQPPRVDRQPRPPLAWVYFIRAGGPGNPIKIGVTGDLRGRIAEMQTAHAEEVVAIGRIHGTARVETEIHRRFAHLRMRGEWFREAPELLEFIAAWSVAPKGT